MEGDYQDINYGITDISIRGKIYSVEFKDRNYKLYYMIYNCRIVVPEDINKYQNDKTNLEYRAESVEAEQLIIPIYIIPKAPLNMSERYGTGGLRRDRFTMYGLYNYYINSRYNGKDLKTSKFLDYIQQCRTFSGQKPTCTTKYKSMGYYFDAIPFFSMIKSKTLEKFPPILETVGGKQKKYKKLNRNKKSKKTKKNKLNKNKKTRKTKKSKKSNKKII